MSKRRKGNNKSVLDTFLYLFIKVKRDDIFALASQLAYYLILSFFPFLIFLITLIGFSNLNNAEVLEGLQSILPTAVFELTASTISEVINSQNTGILGVSGVLAIWAAASAFRAVIKGVNKAYDVDEDRSFIKRSIIGIISVIALALTIICTLAMLVFGDLIGEFLNRFLPFEHLINFIWNILRASLAFSYYVNNFSNYSRLYGSLWAVFVLMTWLFMTSIVFILGVEINSVLEKRKLM